MRRAALTRSIGWGRMRWALGAAAVALSALTGCSSTPVFVRMQLEFTLTARANQNSPVPVSFVAVRDPRFFENVAGKLTAKQWFEQREQLHRDDPSGQRFTEWQWEYVPGSPPPPVVIDVDGDAVAALIFANYRAPGDHRVRIARGRKLRVELGDEDVTVRPIDDREP